jgi:hypothetical protein
MSNDTIVRRNIRFLSCKQEKVWLWFDLHITAWLEYYAEWHPTAVDQL